MDVSELKKNAKVLLDGHPFVVTEFLFVKPGKGQGLYKCKLKNMITGAVIDRTWRSGERFEPANVESRKMQYIFNDANGYTFMDNENYEQVAVAPEIIGDDRNFLLEQTTVDVLFHNNRPVGVTLPSHVIMQIVECQPGAKGDTATNATKDAKLATGHVVQVPLFIKEGEYIKVSTDSGLYIERVKV